MGFRCKWTTIKYQMQIHGYQIHVHHTQFTIEIPSKMLKYRLSASSLMYNKTIQRTTYEFQHLPKLKSISVSIWYQLVARIALAVPGCADGSSSNPSIFRCESVSFREGSMVPWNCAAMLKYFQRANRWSMWNECLGKQVAAFWAAPFYPKKNKSRLDLPKRIRVKNSFPGNVNPAVFF